VSRVSTGSGCSAITMPTSPALSLIFDSMPNPEAAVPQELGLVGSRERHRHLGRLRKDATAGNELPVDIEIGETAESLIHEAIHHGIDVGNVRAIIAAGAYARKLRITAGRVAAILGIDFAHVEEVPVGLDTTQQLVSTLSSSTTV
jgi:hypothetical protein